MTELEKAWRKFIKHECHRELELLCSRTGLEFSLEEDDDCFECWPDLDPELLIQFAHRGQCIAKHCI